MVRFVDTGRGAEEEPIEDLEHGAVSAETVQEMAQGVLALSGADMAVAVSGVAGPEGGTEDKPVGTVWFGWARREQGEIAVESDLRRFDGDRDAVRGKTVQAALQGLRERLRGDG